jgi:hypothetical protein
MFKRDTFENIFIYLSTNELAGTNATMGEIQYGVGIYVGITQT